MRCPLFVELCAGTAAVSLRLAHPRGRPPVSRMGAKTGYADVILRCLGLRPGGGADRYLWCEPDAGVRLLLHAMTSREIATKAAAIIASWKDEDPKALWLRLRAEGPAVCPPVDAREVARFLYGSAASYDPSRPWSGFLHPEKGGRYGAARVDVARKTGDLPTLPATITADARDIDPREVARAARLLTANRLINLDPQTWQNTGEGGTTHGGAEFCTDAAVLADALGAAVEVAGAAVVDDARAVDPPQLPPGVVVYIDPPYLNTTGYSHSLPRGTWLPIVRRWAEAGALVCVNEAEPIPDLMAEGWHAVEITGERVGQKRTFSKQQREWLTMSRPPAWKPSIQGQLFGGRND